MTGNINKREKTETTKNVFFKEQTIGSHPLKTKELNIEITYIKNKN